MGCVIALLVVIIFLLSPLLVIGPVAFLLGFILEYWIWILAFFVVAVIVGVAQGINN